jgi:hypothetical protein
MPYCPKCRDEFQDWVKVCPDCHKSLVDKLTPVLSQTPPSEIERRSGPLSYLTTAPNEAVAGMWQGILAEHNIRSMIKGADLKAAMYALHYNLQCEIFVLDSDLERAREILEPFINEEVKNDSQDIVCND